MSKYLSCWLLLLFGAGSFFAQDVEVIVLGVAQDAGFPQANCQKTCCTGVNQSSKRTYVSSLGILDRTNNQYYIIDCTPDFKEQLAMMSNYTPERGQLPSGIFLTHAHIGHYLGLVELGKEVINASNVPVYAMERMAHFLSSNGPWNLLVQQENIDLKPLKNNEIIELSSALSIQPILVPHRDEYSETVGFVLYGKNQSLLFIPDIDKWSKWDDSILEWVKKVDYALLDGTFYDNKELLNRDMSEIPHPFIEESFQEFQDLSALEKSKIYFTHLNHTNPLLDKQSTAYRTVYLKGFNVASQGLSIYLD